ncbi:MAG: nuclear transport factor 2 family protein [Gammaproteobacteria bacterium]|nr:nuclear transport factor 2 family protein [Gammaproteobacteria bacterium]MDH3534350.1 nuclear transport factor 2 family protein [Gammaproteobacteria bacterium]
MNANTLLIEQFKDYFRVLHNSDLSQLREIYTANIVFKDPVHEIRGLVELEDYFSSMCADLTDCRFEYLDELVGEGAAYVKWLMHFKHPKLGNRLISVRGISHLKIGDKIEFHEDFYDMGAMLYEQLPVLGNVTRWLRLRLAS